MGRIIYFVAGKKNSAYINLTPRYACTNDCVFCDKKALEKSTGNELYLEKEPALEEVVAKINEHAASAKEFVFCGVGEPLLYLDNVLKITKHIKKEYGAKVRINTNGQAYLLYPKRDVVSLLEAAGVDTLSISLNATNESDYNRLHRPRKKGAFDALLRFIKDSNASGIETVVSFIEFAELNKKAALDFTRSLGLEDSQVRFREYLTR
jgi:GTP 3',8-cyclase